MLVLIIDDILITIIRTKITFSSPPLPKHVLSESLRILPFSMGVGGVGGGWSGVGMFPCFQQNYSCIP